MSIHVGDAMPFVLLRIVFLCLPRVFEIADEATHFLVMAVTRIRHLPVLLPPHQVYWPDCAFTTNLFNSYTQSFASPLDRDWHD